MKRILIIGHIVLTLALLIVVVFTSYFSPLSEAVPFTRSITPRVFMDFQFHNNYVRLHGARLEKDTLMLSFDTWHGDLSDGTTLYFSRDGKVRITHRRHPNYRVLAMYEDDDGDGLPEKKTEKEGPIFRKFERRSIDWHLISEKDLSQVSEPTAPGPRSAP